MTGIPTNPLTLRLRALKKALDELTIETSEFNIGIEQELKPRRYVDGVLTTFHMEDSSLATGGAAIEVISLAGGGTYKIHYDKIHFCLYDFFTNLGSILDRLAYEINLFYRLGKWEENRLDWVKLTDIKKEYFALLLKKDVKLSQYIKSQILFFNKATKYRNRLIHDSILNAHLEHNNYPTQFHFSIIMSGNDNKDFDAVEYCLKCKIRIQRLLNHSYKLILDNIKLNGLPPW